MYYHSCIGAITIINQENITKQHNRGKYHAVERLILLLDKGSFCEIGSGITNFDYNPDTTKSTCDLVEYDGVITGSGKINGKPVFVFSQDFCFCGGTLGLNHSRKIASIIKLAIKCKCPLIGIYDSCGARIGEGINSLAGCGEILYNNTIASGLIPQISIIAGPCAGAAAYSPALTDFIFTVENVSYMFITGSDVVKEVTGEEITNQKLGGAKVHSTVSGVAHFLCNNEKECYVDVRHLIDLLPSSYEEKTDYSQYVFSHKHNVLINQIIPSDMQTTYDMHRIINELFDENSFFEIQILFAQSILIGFAKLCGITVGVVANQPERNCGSIDCDASNKAARFVRFCDAFNIPIITLTDTPGYLPGKDQEYSGIIRHGAKLLFAYSEATTPKITVILRRAYGGAYIAMCSKHIGADFTYAWPMAEIAVMGVEGAINIIYKKELCKLTTDEQSMFFQEKAQEYKEKYMNADIAKRNGYVDEIIEPQNTRARLFHDLQLLTHKTNDQCIDKKHGSIPL